MANKTGWVIGVLAGGVLVSGGLLGCGGGGGGPGADAAHPADGGDTPDGNEPPRDAGPQAAAVEITLGAMLPRTGDNANDDWIAAVNLAVTHMNAAMLQSATQRPLKFKTLERDTASKQDLALAAMADFAAAGVPVVLAEASATATGANMYNYTDGNTKLPLVSWTATSADLNNATKTDVDAVKQAAFRDEANWFFRTCQLSGALSAVRYKATFSKGAAKDGDINGDGTVKITWVGTTAASTISSMNADVTAFTAKVPTGVTFKAERVTFDPGADPTTFSYTDVILKATDATTEDTMMADVVPDLIYNKSLTNVSIPFVKAYKQSGRKTPMFQDGSFRRNTMLVALGASADGQEGVSNIAYESTPSGQTFAQALQAKTTFPPAAYDAQAYDAAIVAMVAVAKVWFADSTLTAVSPAATRVALTAINDAGGTKFGAGAADLRRGLDALVAGTPVNYDGASGSVDFDAVGNVTSRAVWWVIEGGRFVEKKIYDCVASADCPEVAP